jgi:hypothetical protein
MINKINFVLILLFFSGNLFSQKSLGTIVFPQEVSSPLTVLEQEQLLEVFGDSFDQMVLNNPTQLRNMKFLLRSRIKIVASSKKDLSQIPSLSDLDLFTTYNQNIQRPATFDKSNFNPLIYQFQWFSPIQQIYRIENTDLLLQIIPQHAFTKN